jgi:hypothetical protein
MSSSRCWTFCLHLDNYVCNGHNQRMPSTDPTTPLTPAVFHILLFALPYLATLSLRPLHLEPALDAWLNGPDPSQANIRGPLFVVGLFLLVMAAGLIAGAPIVRTLRAGGGLFAHPINLVIVLLALLPILWGVASLIIDQWPCFVGVPNCD